MRTDVCVCVAGRRRPGAISSRRPIAAGRSGTLSAEVVETDFVIRADGLKYAKSEASPRLLGNEVHQGNVLSGQHGA